MINKSNALVILVILGFFIVVSFLYFLIYRYQAQKTLISSNNRRFKLPVPQTFILIILLVASLLGNAFSIFNKNTKSIPFYQVVSQGEISSEYKYIEDEVIRDLRGEYEVSSVESNNFIMYYAMIKDELISGNPLLAKYIIYIKYVGSNILEEDLHIKLTTKNKDNMVSSSIRRYKNSDAILMLRSHEVVDLEIVGEIKSFKWEDNKDNLNDDIRETFESEQLLYSFHFEIKDAKIQ